MSGEQQNLANSEYLASYLEVIYENYKPEDVSLYRWSHSPHADGDFLPQVFQDSTPFSVEDLEAPPADAPKDVIHEYVSWFSLSHFVTADDAIRVWRETLKGRLRKVHDPAKREKEIRKWIEKKGQYVTKIDYTEDSGIVGPQGDGVHKQVFPYEGVDVASLEDKMFQPIKIEFDDAT